MDVANRWENNFWGPDEVGYKRVMQHMHHAKLTLEELQQFYKERLHIEQDYAKRLGSLARKPIGSKDLPTIKNSFETVRSTTQAMSASHETVARTIREQILQPLEKFSASLRDRRKAIELNMVQLTKARAHETALTEKEHARYKDECNRICTLKAQQLMLSDRELERNNDKLEKAEIQVESFERKYQESLRTLAASVETWNREWRATCNSLQDLEVERLSFLQKSLWGVANAVSAACVSDDQACETIRAALEFYNPEQDIELFSEQAGTGDKIPVPSEFVNYRNGFSQAPNQGQYTVARFGSLDDTTVPDLAVPSPSASSSGKFSTAPSPAASSTFVGDAGAEGQNQKRKSWALPFKRQSASDQYRNANLSSNSIDELTLMSKPASRTSPTHSYQEIANAKPPHPYAPADSEPIHPAGVPTGASQSSKGRAYVSAKPRPYSYVQPVQSSFMTAPVELSAPSKPDIQTSWVNDVNNEDPLVAALAKLKVEPTKARPKSSYVPTSTSLGPGLAQRAQSHSPNATIDGGTSTTRRNVHRKEVGSMTSLPAFTSTNEPVIQHAIAMYDYRGRANEYAELSFRKGDMLLVVEKQQDGWWYCEINGTTSSGLAPGNFLKDAREA